MMKNKRFLALNGPSKSGKDTLAKAIERDEWFQKHFSIRIHHFAKPIKDTVHKFLQIPYNEKYKDSPMFLGEKTYREAYIAFSEDFAKPVFGKDVFGILMGRFIDDLYIPSWEKPFLVIAPDSGFREEFDAVQRFFHEDGSLAHCRVAQIHRPDFDFTGDSRSYWSNDMKFATILNDRSVEEFTTNGVSTIRQYVEESEWHVEFKGTES